VPLTEAIKYQILVMFRPRAADDFGTIRARMEELRRERAQGLRSRLCRHRQSRDAARGTE
jgi:hypothetical protein